MPIHTHTLTQRDDKTYTRRSLIHSHKMNIFIGNSFVTFPSFLHEFLLFYFCFRIYVSSVCVLLWAPLFYGSLVRMPLPYFVETSFMRSSCFSSLTNYCKNYCCSITFSQPVYANSIFLVVYIFSACIRFRCFMNQETQERIRHTHKVLFEAQLTLFSFTFHCEKFAQVRKKNKQTRIPDNNKHVRSSFLPKNSIYHFFARVMSFVLTA